MRKCFRLGLIALTCCYATGLQARDKPEPIATCPIEGRLRVAGAGSLTGFQSLDGCAGQILIATASPADYVAPQDLRIGPDIPRAVPILASGMVVARIAPSRQEPIDTADATGLDGVAAPGYILALRPVRYTTPYDDMIGRVAERHRIDPLLLHAVINQESRYRERATSPVGARGLMQLMPATARMLGIGSAAIVHAESNVDGGARLLRKLHARYNDFPLVLAAYNAGEGAVAKYGNRIPPYAETQNYVRKVLANYQQLLSEQTSAGR